MQRMAWWDSFDGMDCWLGLLLMQGTISPSVFIFGQSDSKWGKMTPANTREGALPFLRALCESGLKLDAYLLLKLWLPIPMVRNVMMTNAFLYFKKYDSSMPF